LIRITACALALSIAATSAQAQWGPAGGIVPFEVSPPTAAAGANQMGADQCVWAPHGRGGVRNSCEDRDPRGQGR
jgi:hypothetical protein